MTPKQKRATIHDIAREADTSTATVSRVLNNIDYPVSEELRRRIQKAAEKLEYRPNIFSQMLKGGASKMIGIVVPSIVNPFYAQLVSDVERHCIAGGYAPIICSSYNSAKLEQTHLDTLLGQQVAGILLSTINNNAQFVKKLAAIPTPCVLFDQPLPGFKGNSVDFDFRAAGAMAVNHLLERGHQTVAFASQPIDRVSRRLIHQGYLEALKKNGAAPDPRLVITASRPNTAPPEHQEYHCGRELAEKFLAVSPLPEAIAAANDIIAIGLMHALGERGVGVPDDVSIIGFDDIAFSSMVTPGLTTIRQSTAATAESAITLLFQQIEDPKREPVRITQEPELVERRSVGWARSRKWRRN